jgi:hypothetical protein
MVDFAKSKYNPIMEEKIESRMTMIVSAGVLSVALSLPANDGEKISGHNSDYQTLSEVIATIPDKPGSYSETNGRDIQNYFCDLWRRLV